MGLQISHDAWNGPFGSFSIWRNKLAEAAGYSIVYEGYFSWSKEVDYDDYYQNKTWGTDPLRGEWDRLPEEILDVLLVHSDVEGSIYPREGLLLADRLEELLPLLVSHDDFKLKRLHHYTEQFIKGLRLAAALGEPLTFHG
jgi:hypothetical protein